jgi:hypothetical protein
MPARIDHPAVREQVRLLYLSNGHDLTAAAKTAGIPQWRAMKWKQRANWDQSPQAAQLDVSKSVQRIADNLRNELQEHSDKSKLDLAIAGSKAAEHLSGLPGEEVVKKSKAYKEIVSAKSQLHGWDTQQSNGNLDINVLAGGRAMIQINQPGAQP